MPCFRILVGDRRIKLLTNDNYMIILKVDYRETIILEAGMKRNLYLGLLAAEAAFCIAFAFVKVSFAGVFTTVMAFPFEQIGIALRVLSLSGVGGNAAAIALYTAVCISPVAVLLILRKRRKLFPEDGLLVLLSIVLFAVLYLMTNPGIIRSLTGGTAGLPVGKAILGGAAYSVLCGCFVLRLVRLFCQSGVARLARYMTILLGVAGAILVYMAFGSGLSGLMESVEALRSGNTGSEGGLWVSYLILVFGYLTDMIPYLLDVVVVLSALRLLDAMRIDRYSEESAAAAECMSRLCVNALSATVFLGIAYNATQLFLMNALRVVNVTVSIPVFSIVFVLAALLLTRFVAENKRLKDENDAFI